MVVERCVIVHAVTGVNAMLTDCPRYRNQEALQIHLLNPYFQDFGKKAKELMERPYDVKVGSGFLSGSASVTRA